MPLGEEEVKKRKECGTKNLNVLNRQSERGGCWPSTLDVLFSDEGESHAFFSRWLSFDQLLCFEINYWPEEDC